MVLYWASPCHGPWRDTAAPRSVAWRRLPHQRPGPGEVPRHRRCRTAMHGSTAYRIQLPDILSAVHNVFHVSQLKKCLRIPDEAVEIEGLPL